MCISIWVLNRRLISSNMTFSYPHSLPACKASWHLGPIFPCCVAFRKPHLPTKSHLNFPFDISLQLLLFTLQPQWLNCLSRPRGKIQKALYAKQRAPHISWFQACPTMEGPWPVLEFGNWDTDMKNSLVGMGVGRGEGGTNWESSTNIHTVPWVEQTASGKLSTGCSAQRSVMT